MPPHSDSLQLPGLEEAFLLYLSELGELKKPVPVATAQAGVVDGNDQDEDEDEAWKDSLWNFSANHRQTIFSIPRASPCLQKNPPLRQGSQQGGLRVNVREELRRTQSLGPEGWGEGGSKDTQKNVTVAEITRTQSPSAENLDEGFRSITTKLTAVFEDVTQYKRLLKCGGENAQRLLDLFQALLYSSELDTGLRRRLVVAVQRLSQHSGLYPTCFGLEGVQLVGEDPVTAGSFGDIYRGSLQQQQVCLKVIRIYQASRVDYILKRFSQEVILWGQLSHTNLLPFYGLYRFRSRLCLVSPWMDNGDINSYLEKNPDANRILLALDVAAGISHLHENDIIHGDLKGVNILVAKSGRACLADFGLSSVTDAQILNWTSHSSAASKGGSTRWQAPELFDINDALVPNTKASDMYALSCVFYEIFTGNVPYIDILRDSAIMLKVRSGIRPARPPPSSPAWTGNGLTEKIWSLMLDCWAGDPNTRPTIGEAIDRLHVFRPVDQRPVESRDMVSPISFRNTLDSYFGTPKLQELEALISDITTKNPLEL
ncbi:kinase-like domain-containing protein [Collybia nuda]|uniref:Kinase-like domain-containing protein n=1 Tax=Collybia nuda TaxID=64659 RepID=A0A9P5XY16_9AGAR|nr:kinase-like domain-containing protein [Collybia nuda]